ncbi:hypothetical protein B7494_g8397 [Chlorociboria aeruginascens]|nr:hypothetical protein B7494_g8397 [Chlorociboria aeruginascens]
MRIHSTSSISPLLHALVQTAVSAPNCPILQPSYGTPILGTGWTARLIAQGLDDPRDNYLNKFNLSTNHIPKFGEALLTHLWLNHGIAISNDGKTIYASSSESVYSWAYDAAAVSVSGTNRTLITGMSNDDHTTRTLLMSQKEPGTLVVCRGSNSNIDIEAESLDSGHSQIKTFNLNNLTSGSTPYNFTTEGTLLGWGLRNSVGIAEEPLTGGIYSVENSADDIDRNGVDIHENNPGEEMNYHGSLASSIEWKGNNYGYPNCFALWNTSIPDLGDLITGSQFTMDPNSTLNDTTCSSERIPPRLTFQAHMAPLDIIFTPDGSSAYISFHGSWYFPFLS